MKTNISFDLEMSVVWGECQYVRVLLNSLLGEIFKIFYTYLSFYSVHQNVSKCFNSRCCFRAKLCYVIVN